MTASRAVMYKPRVRAGLSGQVRPSINNSPNPNTVHVPGLGEGHRPTSAALLSGGRREAGALRNLPAQGCWSPAEGPLSPRGRVLSAGLLSNLVPQEPVRPHEVSEEGDAYGDVHGVKRPPPGGRLSHVHRGSWLLSGETRVDSPSGPGHRRPSGGDCVSSLTWEHTAPPCSASLCSSPPRTPASAGLLAGNPRRTPHGTG